MRSSILELAKMMIEISSKNLSTIFDEEQSGDIEKSQADILLSKEKIRWSYKTELVDGLKKLMTE